MIRFHLYEATSIFTFFQKMNALRGDGAHAADCQESCYRLFRVKRKSQRRRDDIIRLPPRHAAAEGRYDFREHAMRLPFSMMRFF